MLPARPGVRALPVTVVDHAGVVREAMPAEIPPNFSGETIEVLPVRDDAVLLVWIGGACEDRAIVTIDAVGDRYHVSVKAESSAFSCTAVGISRAVILSLAEPVEAGAFETS
jgi:hypothetical protein